jgi:hypothetical protein
MDVSVSGGAIVLTPLNPGYSLADLIAEAEGCTPPEPVDDEPAGTEWP